MKNEIRNGASIETDNGFQSDRVTQVKKAGEVNSCKERNQAVRENWVS